jgi:hypothetical protein
VDKEPPVLFVSYKFPNDYFMHGVLVLRKLQENYGEVLENDIPNRCCSSSAKIKIKRKRKNIV